MTYETLDVRYRPRRLDDLIGQDLALHKLDGMFRSGRVSRTILLSGPYGSGKTTIARLLAQYLNCTFGPGTCCFDKDPSGDLCYSCSFFAGADPSHPDYTELNCGDKTGIDDIREAIGTSYMAPRLKYRVICLDEAQSLTKNSMSALLKPLEEPPPQTIWILATTEKARILPTILSRCLDVSIRIVSDQDIRTLVERVVAAEKVSIPTTVVDRIVENADGHPRNALKIVEAVINYMASNQDVDVDAVDELVLVAGGASDTLVRDFVSSLLNGKATTLKILDAVVDVDEFLRKVTDLLRAFIFLLAGSKKADSRAMPIIERLTKRVGLSGSTCADLASVLETFASAHAALRSGSGLNPTVSLEVATMKALSVTSRWETS